MKNAWELGNRINCSLGINDVWELGMNNVWELGMNDVGELGMSNDNWE